MSNAREPFLLDHLSDPVRTVIAGERSGQSAANLLASIQGIVGPEEFAVTAASRESGDRLSSLVSPLLT